MARPHVQSGALIPLLENWTCQSRTLYAVYPPQRQTPLPVRLFLDYLSQHLPAGLTV